MSPRVAAVSPRVAAAGGVSRGVKVRASIRLLRSLLGVTALLRGVIAGVALSPRVAAVSPRVAAAGGVSRGVKVRASIRLLRSLLGVTALLRGVAALLRGVSRGVKVRASIRLLRSLRGATALLPCVTALLRGVTAGVIAFMRHHGAFARAAKIRVRAPQRRARREASQCASVRCARRANQPVGRRDR